MMTADAPAACAFFAFVAKVTSPRWISAMWPLTDAGKSAAVLPRPQLTKVSVVVPNGEPETPDAVSVPLLAVTVAICPIPRGTVERTLTPGAAIATSGPKFEKSAMVDVESTAATATTPGYAAG